MGSTITWSGGGNDGVMTNTANWTGGVLPSNTDTAVIGTTGQALIPPSGADFPSGTNVLAAFILTPGFTGTIGGNGSALSLSATTANLCLGGPLVVIGTGTNGITTMNIDSTGNGSVTVAGTGTVATLTCGASGNVNITTGVVTTLKNDGMRINAATGTAFTTVINGGVLDSFRNLGTCTTLYGGLTISESAATFTASTVHGTHQHKSSGTITTLTLYPTGNFNVSGCTSNFTISALERWYGSSWNPNGNGITVTFPAVTNQTLIGMRS